MKETATHTVRNFMFRKHLSYLYEKCLKISHSVGIDSPTALTEFVQGETFTPF